MMRLRLVPSGLHLPFMDAHRIAVIVSVVLFVGSLALLLVSGLNFGIDFRGGTLIEIRTPQAADLAAVRDELNALDVGSVSLQEFGSASDVLIRLPLLVGDDSVQQAAIDRIQVALSAMYPDIEYRRVEFVGPQVSDELIEKGVQAVLVALVLMMIYIWFRFEWQFGVGAVLALAHDVGLTIGVFSLTRIEFDLPVVAALLTIVGYSMNDTVVVYDRIRENLRKYKQQPVRGVIDRSLNDTLSRTVMTSVTTMLALVALWLFGGAVLAPFVLAMIWGVLIGTYSSLFVAAPVLLYLRPVRVSDEREGLSDSS